MGGYLQAMADLQPRKEPFVPTDQEAGWASPRATLGCLETRLFTCVEDQTTYLITTLTELSGLRDSYVNYAVGSKSFRPDIQKPRQMENAVRDI